MYRLFRTRNLRMAPAALIMLTLQGAAAHAAPSLPKIAGQPRDVVDAQLGKPECAAIKYGPKCVYGGGAVEVVYINGLADWITINDTTGMRYEPGALQPLGLDCPLSTATWVRSSLRWDSTCRGLLMVEIAPGERQPDGGLGVFFIYVKAHTR